MKKRKMIAVKRLSDQEVLRLLHEWRDDTSMVQTVRDGMLKAALPALLAEANGRGLLFLSDEMDSVLDDLRTQSDP